MWWIIDVGFSYVIERKEATQAQKNAYISIAKQLTFSTNLWIIAIFMKSWT
jgi:hypothetical protein